MTLAEILLDLCAIQVEKTAILTKSGAMILQVPNESNSETPDAQLHMLANIPVKFQDSS